MKILTTTALIVGALLVSDGALADHKHGHGKHQHGKHHYGKHHRADGVRHHERIRLDIPVRIRGNERIKLRRLLSNYYGINPRHYRLKKVVVDNRSRRDAYARLRVGDQITDARYLSRGRTHLRAPRHSDGRWVLAVRDARINNIRVVLEPKYNWAYNDRPRHHPRPWFEDSYRRW